jgi:signal transduction histidine kinase
MAEFYELLELELRGNKEAWTKLHELFNRQTNAQKGNHVIVKKEIVDAIDTIIEKNESSVNTKSISGDTNDGAASLTSESIHKRLDHSDK